jgi:hypothetical protein
MFIPFSSHIFLQLFTRLNIANGIFSIFRIFFIVPEGKIEITFVEGTKMRLSMINENMSALEIAKKKVSYPEVAIGELHQFEPTEDGLVVNETRFSPITGIVMLQLVGSGKTQRNKDKLS